jgi:thiol-disulfide isomerase/thioredoxin
MRLWRLWQIALAGCVIGLTGCSGSEPPGRGQDAEAQSATPQPAADIDLPLQPSGPPTQLSSLKGKVVVLDFWATWCGPCKLSMPALEKIYRKYKDQGLVVIGISEDEQSTQSQIPDVKKSLGVTYPTVVATAIAGVGDKYPHTGIPAYYVIDKKGIMVKSQEGVRQDEATSGEMPDLDAEVATLLKQP